MRTRPLLLAGAGLLLPVLMAIAQPVGATPSPRQAPVRRVALWNLRTPGVEPELAARVRRELLGAVRRQPGVRLLSERRARRRLQRHGVLPGAPRQQVCTALGVDWLLGGTLAGLGGEYTIDLHLNDCAAAKQLRTATVALPADERGRRDTLAELAVRLLRPEQWVGALELRVSEAGAQVHLDGRLVATTPLRGPLGGLSPGKHILRITKEGFDEFSRFVEVRYGQVARLEVDLKNAMIVGLLYEREKPQPPQPASGPAPTPTARQSAPAGMPAWLGWSLLGGGAALAGVGAYLAFGAQRPAAGMVLLASGGTLAVGGVVTILLVSTAGRSGGNAGDRPGGGMVQAWLSPFSGRGLVVGLRGFF